MALFPAGDARWTALRRQALADGMQDAAVLLRYEHGMRAEAQRSAEWISAQEQKVDRALAAMNEECKAIERGSIDVGTVAMCCAIGYMELRFPERAGWAGKHPELGAWYAGFKELPCAVATAPPQQDPFKMVKERQ